jgi:protein subunit release factor B
MKEKTKILTRRDLDISYFVGSGAGGQNKQKNATGVQLLHRESGALGRCSESRSQMQNRKQAFLNLMETPKMKLWLNRKLYELRSGHTLAEAVEEMMRPEHLRIEIKDAQGNWVEDK